MEVKPNISDIRKALNRNGCQMQLSGGRYVVSGLPTWEAMMIVKDAIEELALLAVAEAVFADLPRMKPLTLPGIGCTTCLYKWDKLCQFRDNPERLPQKYIDHGCELYKKNTYIYF